MFTHHTHSIVFTAALILSPSYDTWAIIGFNAQFLFWDVFCFVFDSSHCRPKHET